MPPGTKPYRVIISGGGTGGHIYPAVAIANRLRELDPLTEFLFVGAQGRMEMTRVPEAGYPIVGLWISGLQRRLTLDNLSFPLKVVSSVLKAYSLIREFKPDVVIGVGGYASGPMLYAATTRRIPTLIQEQNSYAGITNKLLGKSVDRICVAYEGMSQFFPPDKIALTGNPVRQDILDCHLKREEAETFFKLKPGRKTILVLGGSLGARTLNESTAGSLATIADRGYQLIWQTGKAYFPQAQEQVAGIGERKGLQAFEFIRRMDLAYAAADIVISRAGALSISELSVVGKPVILVPSPNVAEDHQTKNALALVRKDAALLVKDQEAREKLFGEALGLLENPERQQALCHNIVAMGRPNATQAIVEEVRNLVK
jgi:UDP-N-acetylglucosamine--N-acetylmuramyl-(pentapeptide) pyrophosphoryl-undecaprenol N-acetylglucosamine transferase